MITSREEYTIVPIHIVMSQNVWMLKLSSRGIELGQP
jgi:hypothetical protein